MRRTIFNDDHEAFRKTLRAFIETEVVPVFDEWFDAGQVPREFYYKLGELGVFGIEVPDEYGGAGEESFKYQSIVTEEVARAGVALGGSGVHVALCLPYLKEYATAEQKQRWLPGFVSGDILFAIAMTEPGTGSDVAAIRTTAEPARTGTTDCSTGPRRSSPAASTRISSSSPPVPHRRGPLVTALAVRRGRHARRLHRGPQARQARPADLGHRRAVLRPTSTSRPPTCSASRTRDSADSAVRPGTARHRDGRGARRNAGAALREYVAAAHRPSGGRSRRSRTPTSGWPRAGPDHLRPGLRRRASSRTTRAR